MHCRILKQGPATVLRDGKESTKAVLHEVSLLPLVELYVKTPLELESSFSGGFRRNEVELCSAAESGAVERMPHLPRLIAEEPEVLLSQILKPEEAILGSLRNHSRHGDAVGLEESHGGCIMTVFLLFPEVVNKDRRATVRSDPEETAARSSLLDGLKFCRYEPGEGQGHFLEQLVVT
jgi:hypothetical protein